MKKLYVWLFCIAVIFLSVSALADSSLFTIALSDADYEELIEMKSQVDIEILSRFGKIEGVVIEPGLYIVGEDIPSGNYYFEGIEGRLPSNIVVYPSLKDVGTFSRIQESHDIGYSKYSSSSPISGKFILGNGNAIEFIQGPAIIHVYKGLQY